MGDDVQGVGDKSFEQSLDESCKSLLNVAGCVDNVVNDRAVDVEAVADESGAVDDDDGVDESLPGGVVLSKGLPDKAPTPWVNPGKSGLVLSQPERTVFFPAPPIHASSTLYHSGHYQTWVHRNYARGG